jgi:hypothetical protein
MIFLLLAFLQAEPATKSQVPVAPPVPQRFSILADPCARTSDDGRDIVVCGTTAASTPRLPLRTNAAHPTDPWPPTPS